MSDFKEDTALILIDIQNDFCPGGALAVNEGNEIVSLANKLQKNFKIKNSNTRLASLYTSIICFQS